MMAANPLGDADKYRILALYEKAVIAQNQRDFAQLRLQQAFAQYNEAAAKLIKESHMPEGTSFSVDTEKQEVTVNPPKPKEEKK